VIEYDGQPGSSLLACDAAARRAVEAAGRRGAVGQFLDREQRRHLARLNRSQRRLVERALAEAAA
jgi:hypothetical protein